MKPHKQLLLLIAVFTITQYGFAQKPIGSSNTGATESDKQKQTTSTTTKSKSDFAFTEYIDSASMVLAMPMYGGGRNGAGVAYDPEKKLYYGVIAGNAKFPMTIFKNNGNVVTDTLSTKVDLRGIWYNSKTKSIEANGYDYNGVISYTTGKNGVPTGVKKIFDDRCQPDANSVGTFDPVHNEIIYYSEGKFMRYSRTTGKYVGEIEVENTDERQFNETAVYTGIPGRELALVDYDEAVIYLYDMSTGENTQQVNLPYEAIIETMFNFSYANGMFWLFDTEYREWLGYKMP